MKTSTILLTVAAVGIAAYFVSKKISSLKSSDGGDDRITTTPPNPYGVTADKTTAENLKAANEYLQQTDAERTRAVVEKEYSKQIAAAGTTGRAQLTTTPTGQQVVVGPTGNVYIQKGDSRTYSYSPGATTKVLGASLISTSSAAKTAQKAATSASIAKALSGPKISAKGKYKAL